MRRINTGSSDSLFRETIDDKKERKTSYSFGRIGVAVVVLFLVCVIITRIQQNAFLYNTLEDCLDDSEGYKEDIEDKEAIIDALEASLVLVGEKKQVQNLRPLAYKHYHDHPLTSRPYRLADVLLLPGSLSDAQVMSAFQNKWSLNDNPLYRQCGLVSSRRQVEMAPHKICHIAVLTSWSPRSCGIATYSSKLIEGLITRCPKGSQIDVLAVRNPNEPYDFYDKEQKVKFSFQKDIQGDNDLAAEFINSNNYDVVILSYEFGIFGDEFLMCLLMQIKNARVITVLHTVADNLPWQKQALTQQVMLWSHKVVVMTETMRREVDWLHHVPASLIQVIPHGVPRVKHYSSDSKSVKSGMERKLFWELDTEKILFSNGLLHQGKGIEHVLAAMPAILAVHSETKYIVQGAPHPTGEGTTEYYHMLQNKVRDLHLEKHVLFFQEFLSDEQLVTKLQHSSVFINAYVDRVASVSGTLIMAMGSGVPCISTAYPFAKEMLADQSGVLVPFEDPESIARAVVYLLSNPEEAVIIGRRAQRKTHSWEDVASMFIELTFGV